MCTKVHSDGPVLHLSTHLENSGPPNILFHCCYTIFQIKKFHARRINMNDALWNKKITFFRLFNFFGSKSEVFDYNFKRINQIMKSKFKNTRVISLDYQSPK